MPEQSEPEETEPEQSEPEQEVAEEAEGTGETDPVEDVAETKEEN